MLTAFPVVAYDADFTSHPHHTMLAIRPIAFGAPRSLVLTRGPANMMIKGGARAIVAPGGFRLTKASTVRRTFHSSSILKHQPFDITKGNSTMATINEPIIHSVFEPQTSTWQYIVADPTTKAAVIIDPVLDYDLARNAVSTTTADGLLATAEEQGYTVEWLLETHAHADHLTAAAYLQHRLEAMGNKKAGICIGKRIVGVQERFAKRYGIEGPEYRAAFDRLLEDDEVLRVGRLEVKVMHLPGHTPDHLGYLVGCTYEPRPDNRVLSVCMLLTDAEKQTYFAATPSSTPTSALPAVISPRATSTSSTPRPKSSSRSPTRSASTRAMTTSPRTRRAGRRRAPPWPSSGRGTSTSDRTRPRTSSSTGGPRGTPGWGSRDCCTRRCNSTSAAGTCPGRRRVAIGS
ncbi:hypothetical protein RB597_001805 [Gaeumannomyces tritici]